MRNYRERAKRRLALGQCAGCGRGPLVTKNHCARCRDLIRAAANRRRERLKAAKVCVECGQAPAETGVTRCAACARRAILRTRRAEAARNDAEVLPKKDGPQARGEGGVMADTSNCRRSTLVHVNCDKCGQKPKVVHRPRNERGACYCENCCPVCSKDAAAKGI